MNQRRRGAGTATETLAVVTLVGVFVAGTACSSGGSSGDDDDSFLIRSRGGGGAPLVDSPSALASLPALAHRR
jgi:hypothetical protein